MYSSSKKLKMTPMNALTELIIEEIRTKGPITFADFMERALYHPAYGYYTSGKLRIGRAGDYYTSPYVHSAFGEVLARFILKGLSVINGSDHQIVELGAGKGLLASDILDSIKKGSPEIYDGIKYYIIERSPTAQSESREALANHSGKVSYLSSLSELGSESFEGVVISNELVDSFPFHRAVWTEGELREIYVSLKDDQFTEVLDKPSTSALEEYFKPYEIEFTEGREVEINLSAGEWIRKLGQIIRRGFLLTVDYGYLAPELFSPQRIKGTYKCIHRHSINENPYINIGEQDITAHVDFSNLIRAGELSELRKVKYTTQGQFLIDWGILDIMEKNSEKPDSRGFVGEKRNAAIKSLFLPGSMGHSFKVLLQQKNLNGACSDFYPESPLKVSFGIL